MATVLSKRNVSESSLSEKVGGVGVMHVGLELCVRWVLELNKVEGLQLWRR